MTTGDLAILTRLELQMMQVIWRDGTSSVTAVQAGLSQELAYTTVQTMLNILVRKGHLQRKLAGRAFLYSAAVSEASATGNALRDLLDRMFGGSGEQLIMALLQDRQIDAKTLIDLTQRLETQHPNPTHSPAHSPTENPTHNPARSPARNPDSNPADPSDPNPDTDPEVSK